MTILFHLFEGGGGEFPATRLLGKCPNAFYFLSFALFLLYHIVLSSCVGGWWWVVFPAITLSQPNYSYGCFVVGVVVVNGL